MQPGQMRLSETANKATDMALIPVLWGELIDKIIILRIKSERITDETALANVAKAILWRGAYARWTTCVSWLNAACENAAKGTDLCTDSRQFRNCWHRLPPRAMPFRCR